MKCGPLAEFSQFGTDNPARGCPPPSVFISGCQNQEIGRTFLFKGHKIGTCSYFCADSATKQITAPIVMSIAAGTVWPHRTLWATYRPPFLYNSSLYSVHHELSEMWPVGWFVPVQRWQRWHTDAIVLMLLNGVTESFSYSVFFSGGICIKIGLCSYFVTFE